VQAALKKRAGVAIPAVVLAESTTGNGPRDAAVNRVIAAVGGAVLPADESTARRAGALRYRARSDATIDALVVAAAAGVGADALILTGERRADHLRQLASGLPAVRVEAV
jgi:predicted nucleic acid-binding protein